MGKNQHQNMRLPNKTKFRKFQDFRQNS